MRDAIIWSLIFAITFTETLIATWEGRADRQSTTATTNKYSLLAALWAMSFELVLLIDMLVVYSEGASVILPILAGAGLGKYWACERRRKITVASAFVAASPLAPHTREEAS